MKPEPIHTVKPDNPQSGHGTVLVEVQLDVHGHVLDVQVRQSAGQALGDVAVRAAMQWEFRPMVIQGIAVPSSATIRFDF